MKKSDKKKVKKAKTEDTFERTSTDEQVADAKAATDAAAAKAEADGEEPSDDAQPGADLNLADEPQGKEEVLEGELGDVSDDEAEETEADDDGKNPVIAHMEKELAATKDQLYRRAAEFENAKKRFERERIQLFKNARMDALNDFLPVFDDLQRTMSSAEGLDIDEKFLEGVELVSGKFKSVLDKHGVTPINEEMVPFDVELHDAMLQQPAPSDDIEANTVLQILEPGYKMGDKVIRHAKVIVSA